MSDLLDWWLDGSAWRFFLFMFVIGGALCGIVLAVVWLSGGFQPLACPIGAREMTYWSGKVSVRVCAMEIPQKGWVLQ